jgi:glutathione S-transferase
MAARSPNPTPSFVISPAAAISSHPMILPRPRWSHEPAIAVCRYQMVYLGRPASELDPDKVKRGYAAVARMEQQLTSTRFLVGETLSLADIALLAYTRLSHEGGFRLDDFASTRRWIGEAEKSLGLAAG